MTVKPMDPRTLLGIWKRWEPFDPESHTAVRDELWRRQRIKELETQLRQD